MGYIIAFLIVLGIICAILGWIKDRIVDLFGWIRRHKKGVLMAVALVAIGFLVSMKLAGAILIVWAVVDEIIRLHKARVAERNEQELREHLGVNCLRCGYMDVPKWKAMLPDFAGRSYPEATSFSQIVTEFAKETEQRYIVDDEKLSWLDPAVHYLTENGIADIVQLSEQPSDGLAYTHITVNEKLIHDALEKLCAAQKETGKPIIERIPIEDDAARKEFGLREDETVPEYYKTAYKISDAMMRLRKSDTVMAMESEELSLDDL